MSFVVSSLYSRLSLLKQWSAFSVGGLDAGTSWRDNDDSCDKDKRHDGECKDPLKSKELGEKLCNTQTSSEEGSAKSDAVILEHDEEETSIDCNSPNGNVGNDSACKIMAVNHYSTIPKDSEEGPDNWQGNCSNVDKSWGGWLTEVEG